MRLFPLDDTDIVPWLSCCVHFYEFSKGMPKISEPEFAHVLLRYTHLDDDEREQFVQRVKERMPEEKVGVWAISSNRTNVRNKEQGSYLVWHLIYMGKQ